LGGQLADEGVLVGGEAVGAKVEGLARAVVKARRIGLDVAIVDGGGISLGVAVVEGGGVGLDAAEAMWCQVRLRDCVVRAAGVRGTGVRGAECGPFRWGWGGGTGCLGKW
jgi:hypothetical protein